jgi:uncharacterized phiE125 gp8 family phage protein
MNYIDTRANPQLKYKVTTQVQTEPISLETARDQLRLDTYGSPPVHEDDDLVTALITAAREWCELYLKRALAKQIVTAVSDSFLTVGSVLTLPLTPIQSIDSITYVDTNGATQTLATSVYTFDEFNNEIVLKYGQRYPATRCEANAVIITYTAGHTDGQSPDNNPCPKPVTQAMLLTIGHLYEHRESVDFNNLQELPLGVTHLLQPYRIGLGL